MNSIRENIQQIRAKMDAAALAAGRDPKEILLCAASKMNDAERVQEAVRGGVDCCGENRVQELTEKQPKGAYTGKPVHFIGHLQTNKVRQLVGKVAMIESVDTERLLELIDRESERAGVVSRVLMQVHVAREETKFGFYPEELLEYFRLRKFEQLRAVHICGVMGMASNTDDRARVAKDFADIAAVYRAIRDDESLGLRGFDTLSMGMSGDWPLAVEHGSNLVRVGTAIFGPRQY